ncbi:MAG: hypothetical protein LW714_03660 [Oxalobacteraceae bacterium]|jgi:tetratricopeptide (TPR) repeat protein|nr:hypothetical protein [Oxalobacteraceae bacterium]
MATTEKKSEISESETKKILQQLYAGSTVGEIIGFESEEFDALYAIGHAHFMQANFTEALKFFQYLLFFNHFDRRAAIGAACCFSELRNFEEALKHFGIALMLDQNDPMIVIQIAKTLLISGKKEEARTVIASLKSEYKNTADFKKIEIEIDQLDEFIN